jgi:hypothetical protein
MGAYYLISLWFGCGFMLKRVKLVLDGYFLCGDTLLFYIFALVSTYVGSYLIG